MPTGQDDCKHYGNQRTITIFLFQCLSNFCLSFLPTFFATERATVVLQKEREKRCRKPRFDCIMQIGLFLWWVSIFTSHTWVLVNSGEWGFSKTFLLETFKMEQLLHSYWSALVQWWNIRTSKLIITIGSWKVKRAFHSILSKVMPHSLIHIYRFQQQGFKTLIHVKPLPSSLKCFHHFHDIAIIIIAMLLSLQ